MRTSSRRMQAVLAMAVVSLVAGASGAAWGATTGFNQTGAGPYDYNTSGNWASSTINDTWDSSLTLTAAQTVTFAAAPVVNPTLTFDYAGAYGLTLDSSSTTTQTLTLGGDIAVNTAGNQTVTIGNATNTLNVDLGGVTRNFNVNTGSTLTFTNIISNGGITVAGGGTVSLSSSNTYTGGTAINGGVLNVNSNAALGDQAIAAPVKINGGTLQAAASFALDNGTNKRNIVLGTSGGTIDTNGNDLTISGSISSTTTGNLTKVGTGTLTLSGSNTYSGATIISAGTVKLQPSGQALVTPTTATAQSAYTNDGRLASHAIDGTGMTPSNPVTVTSTCGNNPANTMWLSNGNTNTWIAFDLGSVQTIAGFHLWNYNEGNYQGRGIQTAGVYVGTSMPTAGASYASQGAAWGTLAQNFTFSPATGAANYTGSDYSFTSPVTTRYIEIFVGSNYGKDAYTGISEIRFEGPNSGLLPATTPVSIAAGATLDLNGANQAIASLADAGGGGLVTNGSSTAATLTLAPTSGTTSFSGTIQNGTGTVALVMNGAAGTVQILSGANTYTGGTTLNSGTLKDGIDNALPTTTSLTVVGGTFDLNGHSQTLAGLTTGSPATGAITNSTGSGVLTLNIGANSTFSGAMTGTLALIKAGTSTLTLTNADTYSGDTTVNAGALTLSGATGSVANSAITVTPSTTVSFDSSTNGVTGTTRAAGLTLAGGTLNVNGNSTANSVDSISGPLTASLQNDTVNLNPNAAKNAQLQIGSFARNPGGIVTFTGTNLGANTIASATPGSSNVVFNTAPTLTGAPSGSGTTVNILAGAFGNTTVYGSGTGLVTYDPANGIRLLNTATEYTSTITDGQTQLDNVRLAGATGTAATFTVNSTTQINSLSIAVSGTSGKAGVTINGTGTLKINSGVIFGSQTVNQPNYGNGSEPASTDAMEITVPTLDFNGQEAVIFTATNFNYNQGSLTQAPLEIQSAITNTNGLTMTGWGELQLSGTTQNNYTGVTTVNSGVLSLNKGGAGNNHAIGGDLVVNGGMVIWHNSEQLPDTSNITLNGGNLIMAISTNTGSSSGETFHNFIMTGGNYYGGSGYNGGGYTTIKGTATFTGGYFEAKAGHVVTISGLTSLSSNASFNIDGSGSNGTTTANLNGGLAITNSPTGVYTPLTIGANSKLALSGGLTFTANATNTNTFTLAAGTGGTVALNGANTFAIGHGAATVDFTVTAPLTDGSTAGSLTKTGAGTLALLANNSYSGTTTISTGTVLVGNGGTSGTLGTGPVINNATLVINRSDSSTVTSAISGTGTLTKLGAGTLTFTAAPTYSGATLVSQGTLAFTALPVVPTAAGIYTFNDPADSGSTITNDGSLGNLKNATLSNATKVLVSSVSNPNGAPKPAGTNCMQLSNSTGVMLITPSNGKGIDISNLAATTGWTASAWFNGLYSAGGWRTLFRGDGNDHQVIIQSGGYGLGLYDNTVGNNFYGISSTYNVNDAAHNITTGWHQITAVGSGGNTSYYVDGNYVGKVVGHESLTDIYSVDNWSGSQPFATDIAQTYVFQTALTPTQVTNLYKITQGIAIVPTQTTMTANSAYTIASGATFAVNDYVSLDVPSITGAGNITLGSAGTAQLTIGRDNSSATFSGVISGSGALVKSGTGTVTLTASNTYTGGTTVSGGELDMTVTSLPANSAINVAGGKLLVTADSASHTLVTLASLTGSTGGTLDLTNHDLLIPNGLQNTSISTYLKGLVSTQTPVAGAPDAPTTIALVSGKDYKALGGPSTLADTDLYGRFTFKGDANLDGKITADDYLALDVGYLFGLTGWTHGDFEQTTGTITAQDYADIDLSYQNQNGKTAAAGEIALHTQWFGAAYTNAFAALNAPAVPEPASLGLLAVGALALLRRRK